MPSFPLLFHKMKMVNRIDPMKVSIFIISRKLYPI